MVHKMLRSMFEFVRTERAREHEDVFMTVQLAIVQKTIQTSSIWPNHKTSSVAASPSTSQL
jgi:hypothetical protein